MPIPPRATHPSLRMTLVALTCLALVVSTTMLHYEALRLFSAFLPRLRMAPRARLIVVMLAGFAVHALEIVLYAGAIYTLAHSTSAGTLGPGDAPTWTNTLYFSAETYTSLGYGDVVPHGALRMLSGVEALNGLLLIGWTASFVYVTMEQLWRRTAHRPHA